MKIMDFLSKDAVTVNIKGADKDSVLKEMVDLLITAGEVDKKHRAKLIELLKAREELGSTAIGQGVGIPHAKSEYVSRLIAAFGISKKGVNFDSLDGEPVHIFFMLLAPQDSAGPHLKALARISRLLKDKYFREGLKSAPDEKTVLRTIQQEDEKKV